MPRNVYFSQGTTPEKRLYEDITIEALKIYGHDVYYIPRTIVNTDAIFNEDALSKFGEAFQVEMYLENTDGFEGDGDLLSKFGVEIRDSMTLVLATRRWEELVGRFQSTPEGRPQEGDLIYFPLVKGLFQITYVEDDNPFYQLSNLPTFKLTCELFEYGNEAIDTGIAEVDAFETDYATRTQLTLGAGVGTFNIGEDIQQTKSLTGFPEETHVHDFPIWKTITGEVSTISNTDIQLNALETYSNVDVNMVVGSSDRKTIVISFNEPQTINATHVTIINLSESYLSDFEGTFEITQHYNGAIYVRIPTAWPNTPTTGITAATVELNAYGYAAGTIVEVSSLTANSPFGHVNGAVNNSTTVVLDNNGLVDINEPGMYGTLSAGMSVTGNGVPEGVTIQSVTSQTFSAATNVSSTANISLSQKVTLADNTPLTFAYPSSEIIFNTTSGTTPGNLETVREHETISYLHAGSYPILATDSFGAIDSNDPYADNEDFETIGNNFIDFTETNPFGEPDITS